MSVEQALVTVLESGAKVSSGNWHIWKNTATGEYVLDRFDDYMGDPGTEERFTGAQRSNAIRKFLEA